MINVLVVEDHALIQMATKILLRSFDCNVDFAETGKETLGLLKKNHYDIVFLDLGLPDISGLEVTHRLLSHQEPIKILIVSAATNDLLPFKLLDAGALGYLTKNASRQHNNQR